MSSSLAWWPLNKTTKTLPTELKFALRKRYGEPVDAIFSQADVAYLQGLDDAGVKGAAELLKLIERYNDVVVREEY